MTGSIILRAVFGLVLYFLVQVFVLKDIVLFGEAFCFLYLFALLLLPLEVKTIPLMLMAFLFGLGIDAFYDTTGMHAASLVLITFIRSAWVNANTPRGGYEENVPPTVLNMGLIWFTAYALPLVLLHHLVFFYIDMAGIETIKPLVTKVLSSTFFTFIFGLIVQLLFYQRKRGI
ncbi:MAG: rod shape-determining protein MreD [Lunatimonas sp.]|uniref:rod shape-determining protein MreD n=1 Tax=Lunatimonas sp. TaxID=2060141 RepID=UPI00263BCBC6|nr:rod shape-determining protein MreD [Lunatimonas sp.]MCC5939817.1 rod shape-determining protein MreD [Lunatimonas sp.]